MRPIVLLVRVVHPFPRLYCLILSNPCFLSFATIFHQPFTTTCALHLVFATSSFACTQFSFSLSPIFRFLKGIHSILNVAHAEIPCHMRPRFLSLADIILGSARREVTATMVVFRSALHGIAHSAWYNATVNDLFVLIKVPNKVLVFDLFLCFSFFLRNGQSETSPHLTLSLPDIYAPDRSVPHLSWQVSLCSVVVLGGNVCV